MNKVDYSNLNGFPLDQDNLDFLQKSYSKAFEAIAKLCGDKTILFGLVPDGNGNISAGWVSYNGELLPFIGGAAAAQVKITETVTAVIFEDNVSRAVEFVRVAELVTVGDFDFADLQPLGTVLANKALIDASVAKLALITHYVSHFETGFIVGDITNDKILTVNIPDQATDDYVVGGSLRGLNNDPNQDNDQMWIVSNKTPTSFKLAIREVPGAGVQNLVFDFTITKAI